MTFFDLLLTIALSQLARAGTLPREVPAEDRPPWRFVRHDQAARFGGGENYLAHQKVDIYVLRPPALFPRLLPNGTQLQPARRRVTVTTDAEGRLPAFDLGILPPGLHCVVADYNGDGEFTAELDGSAYCVVWPPPASGRHTP
jgi:hypothetical protein